MTSPTLAPSLATPTAACPIPAAAATGGPVSVGRADTTDPLNALFAQLLGALSSIARPSNAQAPGTDAQGTQGLVSKAHDTRTNKAKLNDTIDPVDIAAMALATQSQLVTAHASAIPAPVATIVADATTGDDGGRAGSSIPGSSIPGSSMPGSSRQASGAGAATKPEATATLPPAPEAQVVTTAGTAVGPVEVSATGPAVEGGAIQPGAQASRRPGRSASAQSSTATAATSTPAQASVVPTAVATGRDRNLSAAITSPADAIIATATASNDATTATRAMPSSRLKPQSATATATGTSDGITAVNRNISAQAQTPRLANASEPTASQGPATAPALPPAAEQVLDAIEPMQHRSDGSYHLKLELSPHDLGRVEVSIEMHDGVLAVHMHAENADTQRVLHEQLNALRDTLHERGVATSSLDVGGGRTSDHANQPRDFAQSRQASPGATIATRAVTTETDAKAIAPQPRVSITPSGSQHRLDTHA